MELFRNTNPVIDPIRPFVDMGAYEALWLEKGASFKRIAERFRQEPNVLPSDLVSSDEAEKSFESALDLLRSKGVNRFGIRINRAGDYPEKLRDAKDPVELLYYQGTWELVDSNCVAVVGTRNPTSEGVARTKKLAKLLVENNKTVVSGLANGVDTVAHITAINEGGRTIAVIGTPIGDYYPKHNKNLQDYIAANHLLISQVPILKYSKQSPMHNRFFFPERNKTMSALTSATIIVEAGETSGTLIQARAALHQGRKLLLLDSLFQNEKLSWPQKYLEQGAIRVKEPEDIIKHVN